MDSSDKRVAVKRAIAETVKVISARLEILDEEKAARPELVKQVKAILARKGRRKRPKQKLTKGQVEILERADTEGIAPKRKPSSLRPAWWSNVEHLIVVLRQNITKEAADKIENEINYEVRRFYLSVIPKAVDELEHSRDRTAAEENSARWLVQYLGQRWLAEYLADVKADLTGGLPEVDSDDPDQLLSARKLADRLGMPTSDSKGLDRVRKRLESWRKANLDGGWIETKDPRPRDPRYLYPLGRVWGSIEGLRASG